MDATAVHPLRDSLAERLTRRYRTRRILKWTGTCCCVLTLAAAVVTLRWSITWTFRNWGVGIWDGAFAVFEPFDPLRGVRVFSATRNTTRWAIYAAWFRHTPPGQPDRYLTIPLWIPFVAIGLPTAWLWWRDWRFVLPGCCRTCKYDLTGNTTGICPECGASVESPK